MNYDEARKKFESKLQKEWEESGVYNAIDYGPKADKSARPKYYALFEFPYPSGDGLHVGHLRPYIGMDVISRKRRMEGYNVLFPIGWDAFGLPTENYAIKNGISPEVATKKNTDNFRRQIKSVGPSLDWSREINTTDPEYYKWTQWMFLKFFEKGMAYKAKKYINWCPKDKIGLANEEAAGGVCDRCGGPVEKREKEQWMIRITKYADRLLEGLKDVDYIPQAKIQQENWIGRSEGAEIEFPISVIASEAKQSSPGSPRPQGDLAMTDTIKIFTTRPDTLFGATYMVLAPEHPIITALQPQIKNFTIVKRYIEDAKKKGETERTSDEKDKTGVMLEGIKAINPATKEEIPVWVADYVLPNYGTGAIMAVPAHDERDFAFAKKYKLPIRPVIIKIGSDCRSYVMGVDEKDLKNLNVVIHKKTPNGFYVSFPKEKIEQFKVFIRNVMKPHFWNEFSTDRGFYFIFKHKDGRLEEFLLDEKNNDIIDRYGMTFNDQPIKAKSENVYGWLADGEWYKDILIHSNPGILVNSGKFDGLSSEDAKKKITEAVGGKITVKYKLRDWVFSRQRYWGEPIPLVFCENCAVNSKFKVQNAKLSEGEIQNPGWIPIPEKELPVKLPKVEKYQPTDTGESPLANITDWVNVKCPRCKGPAKRETDTMPNWAGSSWYFLRYCDPHNPKEFASMAKLKYWMGVDPGRGSRASGPQTRAEGTSATSNGVDWYNGGMEHTVLHLLYSRFWNMFLYDLGLVPTSEPYKKRTSHGLVLAEGGVKMSKSKGNVVNPDELVEKYGADALRVYEMFMGPFDQAIAWDTRGILGASRFLEKVWNIAIHNANGQWPMANGQTEGKTDDNELLILLHKTIKKVSEDIEKMAFNTAVSSLMIFINKCDEYRSIDSEKIWKPFLRLLAPFAPHITEHLWQQMLGNSKSETRNPKQFKSIHLETWPKYDEKLIKEETFELVVQINGRTRGKVVAPVDISQADAEKLALEQVEVKKWITAAPKKVIFVKNRLINFII